MGKNIDLFLSHNENDKHWVERLAGAIEADRNGPPLRVFFDKWDIGYGANIPSNIEEALKNSKYVGLVLSPEAISSSWVALERSAVIYRDLAARKTSLIPILRRTCELPDLIAPLRNIDFRREEDFDAGLKALIATLRGQSPQRGGELDPADVHFREDAELLKKHRQIFDRPAFAIPCVMELFLPQLIEAIDDTVAAINTGSLYSRSGKQLGSLPSYRGYMLPEFKQAFSRITVKLTAIKRKVTEFEEFFMRVNPNYSHHKNFYSMVILFSSKKKVDVKTLVQFMDDIDQLRNEILNELNSLLSKCDEDVFDYIELTSELIKRGGHGWDHITKYLK